MGGYSFDVRLFDSHPSTGFPARREFQFPVPTAAGEGIRTITPKPVLT
jgi:hypothetical protein